MNKGEKMKAIEFCYWLQGTFEILEMKSFDEKATANIKRNLDKVFEYDKNGNYPFCNWLQGFFDIVKPEEINEEQAKKIEEKLYSVFEHVIQIDHIQHSNTTQLDPNRNGILMKC